MTVGFIGIPSNGEATREAATYIVDINGNGDFTSIRDAIDYAASGDTIFVKAGAYNEDLVINKSISIVGEDMDNTSIEGKELAEYASEDYNEYIVQINADDVVMRDFTITNNETQIYSYYQSGLGLGAVRNVRISEINCSNVWHGIDLFNSIENIINNCTIYSEYHTIGLRNNSNDNIISHITMSTDEPMFIMLVENSRRNTIQNNRIVEGDLYLVSSSKNLVSNNTLVSNSSIYIGGSDNVLRNNNLELGDIALYNIEEARPQDIDTSNTMNGSSVYYLKYQDGGIIPAGAGKVILYNCTNIIVDNQSRPGEKIVRLFNSHNCTISNNSGMIQLMNSNFNLIEYNSCSGKKFGISLTNSSNNLIRNNTCYNSTYGVFMEEDSNFNLVENNLCHSMSSAGIEILFCSPPHSSAFNNIVQNNTCMNSRLGIYLWDSPNTIAIDNTCIKNTHSGFHVGPGNGYFISNNMISDNRYGIYAIRQLPNSMFRHNNFIDNEVNFKSCEQHVWTNELILDNYWSNYNGSDDGSDGRVAGDGVGDTLIPHLGLDYTPYMEPWGWREVNPPFLSGPANDTDGNFSLTWTLGGMPRFILEESPDPSFSDPRVVYEGRHISLNLTMNTDGVYYYRVKGVNRTDETEWSNIINVTVDRYPDEDGHSDEEDDGGGSGGLYGIINIFVAVVIVLLVAIEAWLIVRRRRKEASEEEESTEGDIEPDEKRGSGKIKTTKKKDSEAGTNED